MSLLIQHEGPSALLRRQVKNISFRMSAIVDKTILSPLRSMTRVNQLKGRYAEVEGETFLCLSVMDHSQSIEGEDRADRAAHALMCELVDLKNEANDLVSNETTGTEKPWRF